MSVTEQICKIYNRIHLFSRWTAELHQTEAQKVVSWAWTVT